MAKRQNRVRTFTIGGLFCEDDCKTLKAALDGKTYYRFRIFWGSWAGNCVLNVETDYPHGTIAEAKAFFVHFALSQPAEYARPLLRNQETTIQ